jgi:dTMP kinase
MKNIKGKFIVIEGIDGAGGETQTKLLRDYLGSNKVKNLSYPDYKNPVGKIIHEYLHNKYDLSVDTQFLLYSIDFLKDGPQIRKWLKEGKIIITDRYFTSTIAYQGLRGFNIKKALNFAEIFDIPKPDLIIYLGISARTSVKRKYAEKRSLDRNEKNKIFLEKLGDFYEKLAKNSVFGKWEVVNGEKSIDEVSNDIKNIINTKL